MTYFLEFCDADDQRLKTPLADRIESPIVIPTAGDTVMVEQNFFTVVHRQITYTKQDTTVICFCHESHEGIIREHCGQQVDLSSPSS